MLASCAPRFCRTHRGDSIFVDLNHKAPGVCAARESPKASWPPRNDRMGISAVLDRVPLSDLLVQKRVESVPAGPKRIDLAHGLRVLQVGSRP
jgi:hypothetical protein